MPHNLQHISVNLTLIWIHGAQGSIYLTVGRRPTHVAVTVTGLLSDIPRAHTQVHTGPHTKCQRPH